MRLFFIFNNLKVNSFILDDSPFPGFELLSWDHETYTIGTLWDIGGDAGYTQIGVSKIEGQLWLAHDLQQIEELEYFLGAKTGLTEPLKTKIFVNDNGMLVEIEGIIYSLRTIKSLYSIIPSGKWTIKRDPLVR